MEKWSITLRKQQICNFMVTLHSVVDLAKHLKVDAEVIRPQVLDLVKSKHLKYRGLRKNSNISTVKIYITINPIYSEAAMLELSKDQTQKAHTRTIPMRHPTRSPRKAASVSIGSSLCSMAGAE